MVLKRRSRAGMACLAAITMVTAGFAETLTDRLDLATEKFASKHGVEIGGGMQSEYFNSSLSGSAATDTLYTYETTQFTSLDLDMSYRPYDFVGARAIVRFQQDWQTFFATRSRVVGARWLSMDGNLDRLLSFHAGDFRQKLSPLTVWAPELDLIYEPGIFADARTRLMDDRFLGDNQRLLQGLDLDFAKRLAMPISEVRADAIASRIRRAEFLDADGWQALKFGPDADGDGRRDPLSLASADMDRYFLGGNAEALLWDNAMVAATYQALFDDRESFLPLEFSRNLQQGLDGIGQPGALDGISYNGIRSVVASDLRVLSLRGGADAAGFLGNPDLTLEVLGEYATSSESRVNAWQFRRDSVSKAIVVSKQELPGQDGTALNLSLGAGYASPGKYAFKLDADYLDNSEGFENPLAQTPTFVAARILNTENDQAGGRLYSTFDALNDGVYKFTPGRKTPAYQNAPFSKTSYNSGTFTSRELSGFTGDPVVQLLLPMGMATPNRMGFKARLSGDLLNAYHLILDFASLKEVKGQHVDSLPAEAVAYTQIGGGAKVDLDKAFGWGTPLSLSVSYVRAEADRAPVAGEIADPKIETGLLQAGLSWHFYGKWGILAGYQHADLKSPYSLVIAKVRSQYDLTETQSHFRSGVEYALTRQATFLLSGGLLKVEREGAHRVDVVSSNPDSAPDTHSDFAQVLTQALIKVRF